MSQANRDQPPTDELERLLAFFGRPFAEPASPAAEFAASDEFRRIALGLEEAEQAVRDASAVISSQLMMANNEVLATRAEAQQVIKAALQSDLDEVRPVLRDAQERIEGAVAGAFGSAIAPLGQLGVGLAEIARAADLGATIPVTADGLQQGLQATACPDPSGLQQTIEFVDAFRACGCCDPDTLAGPVCQSILSAWVANGNSADELIELANCPTPPPDDPVPPPPDDPDPSPVASAPVPAPTPPPPPTAPQPSPTAPTPPPVPITPDEPVMASATSASEKCRVQEISFNLGTSPVVSSKWDFQDGTGSGPFERRAVEIVQPSSYRVYTLDTGDAVAVRKYSPGQIDPDSDGLTMAGESHLAGEAMFRARQFCEAPKASGDIDSSEFGGLVFLDWGSENICELVAGQGPLGQGLPELTLSWIVGLSDQFGSPRLPDALRDLTWWGFPVGETLGNIVRFALDGISVAVNELFGDADCFGGEAVQIRILRILIGFARKYVSDDLLEMSRPLDYLLNSKCPTILPDVQTALQAFLADAIDEDLLKCWVEANGHLWGPFQKAAAGARTKPTAFDSATLFRRNTLSEEAYREDIRALGYTRNVDPDLFFELTRAVPPVTDIIRFMVRDTADQTIIDRFELDTDFENKFVGQLQQWATDQGISEDYAKFAWRAHWRIPSPTQLFEMLHRLRKLPDGDPQKVTEDDVRTALKQDDVLPPWITPLLAISFRPLTRIDLRRAFDIGELSKEDVRDGYEQLGYSDENANILAEFTATLKSRRFRTHRWVKAYIKGAVNRDNAIAYLQQEGATAAEATDAVDLASRDILAQSQAACVASTRKRVIRGELTTQESSEVLQSFGLDSGQAFALSQGWSCERTAAERQPSTSQLCEQRNFGQIDDATYVASMQRLNWSPDEITRIAAACDIKFDRRLLREQRRAEADARRMESVREAKSRKKDARELRLLKATQSYAKFAGISVAEAGIEIDGARKVVRGEFDLSLAESVDVAEQAGKNWRATLGVDLLTHMRDVAEASRELETSENGNGQPT